MLDEVLFVLHQNANHSPSSTPLRGGITSNVQTANIRRADALYGDEEETRQMVVLMWNLLLISNLLLFFLRLELCNQSAGDEWRRYGPCRHRRVCYNEPSHPTWLVTLALAQSSRYDVVTLRARPNTSKHFGYLNLLPKHESLRANYFYSDQRRTLIGSQKFAEDRYAGPWSIRSDLKRCN
jgi:hypothetical protein